MTVTHAGNQNYVGLASDPKPANPTSGATYFAYNTSQNYFFNGSAWVDQYVTNKPSVRKWSQFFGGIAGSQMDGFMGGLVSIVSSGVALARTISFNDGINSVVTTPTSGDTNAGLRSSTTVNCMRGFNPHMKGRAGYISGVSDVRLYFGYQNVATDPTGDDHLSGRNGVFIAKKAADTNWFVVANNGGATSGWWQDTGIAAGASGVFELFLDDSGQRYGYSINGSAVAYVTSGVPAQTTALNPVFQIQTSVHSGRGLGINYWELEQDR